MIHERDRRTDRQTDGRTDRHRMTACIASRSKNASQHVLAYLQQFPSYSNHNCKKSPFLRTPAFMFCLPWRRPCGNHAKRCMNEKTIQCLPNPSQHVPIYIQQFPSYTMLKSMRKSKNRYFYHIFVSPKDASWAITLNVVWMEREFDAYKLSHCMDNAQSRQ